MFRGNGHHKVDTKGRVSVPASFRRVLEAGDPDWVEGKQPRLVVHHGAARDNFIECYTMEAASEVDSKIAALKRGSRERRLMEAYFSAQSYEASVDDNGRLLLSREAREKIGLEGEALFVAALDTFHIWKPETYRNDVAPETEAELDALPDDMDPLLLLEGGVI